MYMPGPTGKNFVSADRLLSSLVRISLHGYCCIETIIPAADALRTGAVHSDGMTEEKGTRLTRMNPVSGAACKSRGTLGGTAGDIHGGNSRFHRALEDAPGWFRQTDISTLCPLAGFVNRVSHVVPGALAGGDVSPKGPARRLFGRALVCQWAVGAWGRRLTEERPVEAGHAGTRNLSQSGSAFKAPFVSASICNCRSGGG